MLTTRQEASRLGRGLPKCVSWTPRAGTSLYDGGCKPVSKFDGGNAMLKKAVLVVLLAAGVQPSVAQTQRSSCEEMRRLLSSLGDVVLNSDTLAQLFKIGDQHIADLIKLLDDRDRWISVRAQ